MNLSWCSWEIRIRDAFKLQDDKIAILPVAENNGA